MIQCAAVRMSVEGHTRKSLTTQTWSAFHPSADVGSAAPGHEGTCTAQFREEKQRPHPWHARAGGGAVHSINSGSRPYSITSSARARSAGGLRDQLRRKPWPRRSTSWTSITSVAGAILVNAPTLGGWYLLQGQAVAISRTTGIYALLFSGLSRRKSERGEIGVTRIECSRTQ